MSGDGTLPASCVGYQKLYVSDRNSRLHQGKALPGQLSLVLVHRNLTILWPEGPTIVTARLTRGLRTLCLPAAPSPRVLRTPDS